MARLSVSSKSSEPKEAAPFAEAASKNVPVPANGSQKTELFCKLA